jgi:hypothetical protein
LRSGRNARILHEPYATPQEMPPMKWTMPTFVEIKMDAEIGSYQQDEEEPTSPIADSAEHERSE